MKTNKCFRYIIFINFFIFLIAGCQDNAAQVSFVKVESEPTNLMNGIKSYQSIDEFKMFLSRSSFHWEESIDTQPMPKGRPPYNISTITINNYSHLGFSGELNICFFNNRLISTTFYPKNSDKYIAALSKSEGIMFSIDQETKLPLYTSIRYAIDHNGRKYIRWSDIRLDKEIDLWIRRYS